MCRSSEPGGGAWLLKSLDALNASVRQGWVGTIGAQLRMQLDKAPSVMAGIHFDGEGTMWSASALRSTGLLTNNTLSTGTSAVFLFLPPFLGVPTSSTHISILYSGMWDECAHLLSEATAVDLGDGVGRHGAPDARAGWRTLRYWSDAVGRVLTGWGEGRVARHAQTVFCDSTA